MCSGHASTSYAQAVESSFKVSIIDCDLFGDGHDYGVAG